MGSQIELLVLDIVGFRNLAIRIDQVADPPRDSRFEILLALLATGIVCGSHRLVWVRQEGIGEALGFGEFLLVCHRIEGNAQHDRVGAFERLFLLTEPVALNRSTRGRGLGVPPHRDPFTREPGAGHLIRILILGREIGCVASNGKHCHLLMRSKRETRRPRAFHQPRAPSITRENVSDLSRNASTSFAAARTIDPKAPHPRATDPPGRRKRVPLIVRSGRWVRPPIRVSISPAIRRGEDRVATDPDTGLHQPAHNEGARFRARNGRGQHPPYAAPRHRPRTSRRYRARRSRRASTRCPEIASSHPSRWGESVGFDRSARTGHTAPRHVCSRRRPSLCCCDRAPPHAPSARRRTPGLRPPRAHRPGSETCGAGIERSLPANSPPPRDRQTTTSAIRPKGSLPRRTRRAARVAPLVVLPPPNGHNPR